MNWYSSLKLTVAGRFTEHFRNASFHKAFAALPNDIKELARQRFRDMVNDRSSVNLKKLPENGSAEVWSASIKEGKPSYRALAVRHNGNFIWYWIGTHEEYNTRKQKAAPQLQLPAAAAEAVNNPLPKNPFPQQPTGKPANPPRR